MVHKIAHTRKQFLWFMVGLEDIAQNVYGFAPDIISAQIALETAYGKKVINHNLFNIKATKSWKGETCKVMTTEYISGKPKKMFQYFRAYNSYLDSLKDYVHLLHYKRYADAWAFRKNPRLFFQALVNGGYATDPEYSKSLLKRFNTIQHIERHGETIG